MDVEVAGDNYDDDLDDHDDIYCHVHYEWRKRECHTIVFIEGIEKYQILIIRMDQLFCWNSIGKRDFFFKFVALKFSSSW